MVIQYLVWYTKQVAYDISYCHTKKRVGLRTYRVTIRNNRMAVQNLYDTAITLCDIRIYLPCNKYCVHTIRKNRMDVIMASIINRSVIRNNCMNTRQFKLYAMRIHQHTMQFTVCHIGVFSASHGYLECAHWSAPWVRVCLGCKCTLGALAPWGCMGMVGCQCNVNSMHNYRELINAKQTQCNSSK